MFNCRCETSIIHFSCNLANRTTPNGTNYTNCTATPNPPAYVQTGAWTNLTSECPDVNVTTVNASAAVAPRTEVVARVGQNRRRGWRRNALWAALSAALGA